MYVPAHFAETDPGVLRRARRRASARHVGDLGRRRDRRQSRPVPARARARRAWHARRPRRARESRLARLSPTVPSVVVFQGADAYISPSWYPGKRAHGKVVPTWNYAVVHAHGIPRAIEDRAWLHALVTRLTDTHEAKQAAPWQVADAPAEYVDSMLRGDRRHRDPGHGARRQVEGQPEPVRGRHAGRCRGTARARRRGRGGHGGAGAGARGREGPGRARMTSCSRRWRRRRTTAMSDHSAGTGAPGAHRTRFA